MDVDTFENYKNAHKRLFLLDYDGCLAPIVTRPEDAAPTPEILEVLKTLAADTRNEVVIISGRNHQDLDAWLGGLHVSFAAEHGLLFKSPGSDWVATSGLDDRWKPAVRELFESYVNQWPGSFVEEKTNGMVWHYRPVDDQEGAEEAAQQLAADLEPLRSQYGLRIMAGNKIIETQPQGVSKAIGVLHWLEQAEWDFILAAGDDVTDEDTFAALPKTAYTIKVGDGDTIARARVATPAEMMGVLRKLQG